ncbi:MAG: monovalent cation/H+ antiporter subunit D family protein [Gammaproteobacteria bacterium]|nr:monovalent cation/H+ antiporter subunit D family protein [Gammaproteobacteria bacterium]
MLAPHLPMLQVLVPLLTAPFVLLLQPRGLAWAAATAASLMAFAIAVMLALTVVGDAPLTYQVGRWPAPYGIELRVDDFSALLLLIITGASSVTLLGGWQSLAHALPSARQPYYFSAWLLALTGFVGIAVSADAFNIFVFMEVSSLASYVLIAGGPDRRALSAVFKYLIMGTVGATFYLVGIGLVYMMTGTLNLADMAVRISDVADTRPVLLAAGFITVGLALKAAIFPLHIWLPNAYAYAPHIATAFLAACATKVALYVLLRFDFVVLQHSASEHAVQFAGYLMPLAVLGILVGSGVAIFERDLKRLLAFSSVAQIGYMLLGASLVTIAGLNAAILHMFNHALAKGGLFLVVAAFCTVAASSQLEQIGGIARKMPWTFAAFVVCGLSLIGVPGTAGFLSKWYLVTAALDYGALGIALVGVILVSSLMAVVYIWRVVESACFAGEFGDDADSDSETAAVPPLLFIAVWIVALANLYFGLASALPIELAASAANLLMGNAP